MVDTNVSSFSSGGSGQLPGKAQQQPKSRKKEEKKQGVTSKTQGKNSSVKSSQGDSTSSKSTDQQESKYASAPSIMQYTESVDIPKFNLSEQLFQDSVSNYDIASRFHQAGGINTLGEMTQLDQAEKFCTEVHEVYDAEKVLVGGANKAIGKFNHIAANAAKNKEVDGTTLVDATKQLNQQITAYNNGEITADQLQQDIGEYNDYLSDWDAAMSGEIAKVNTAIDAYNKVADELNKKIDALNSQMDGYQLPEVPTLPNIPSSGIPPLSTNVGDPPISPIPAPEGVKPIQLPSDSQPPPNDQLEGMMINPPETYTTTISSMSVMAVQMQVMQKNSEHSNELLKKLKTLPVQVDIMPQVQYDEKSDDGQTISTPVIDNLGQLINQQMLTSSELVKQLLGKDDAFIDQMAMMTQQIIADSVLSAVTDTYKQLSGQRVTDHAIDIVTGVNLSRALKRELESGRVHDLVSTMNLPQDETQKVSDMMNLTLNMASSKFLSMAFGFKGLEEQTLAQGFEGAGLDFPRGPIGFNHTLNNGFVVGSMISISEKTLASQYHFSDSESNRIANSAVRDLRKQAPFGSLPDMRSALSANFRKAGISNSLQADRLASDITRTLATFMPFTPATDSSVSQKFQLSFAQAGSLQSELEGRFDTTIASSLMEGVLSNPKVLNEEGVGRKLALAVDVSSRIPGGASTEQLKQLGITDPGVVASIQSLQSQPLSSQQAFRKAMKSQLVDGMKVGPEGASRLSEGLSFDDIVNSSSLVEQLSNIGLSQDEAKKVTDQVLSIPEAYQNEETFKSALQALLPAGFSSENIELSGVIDHEELSRQIDSALVKSGASEAVRNDVLGSLQVNSPLSSASFSGELAKHLVARTGMSYEQASKVADGIVPGSILDFDYIGDALVKEGLDHTIVKPVLDNILSVGKFAEMVRDLSPGEIRIDLEQLLESSVQTEKLQNVIRVGLESQGASPEEADAMARRGSLDLFKAKTQPSEFNSIYSMQQPKLLESTLKGFFKESGVPEPLPSELAEKASALFFANEEDVVDSDSYYQGVQNAINQVLMSDAYEYDLSAFIGDQTVSKLKGKLGMTMLTRAEIFNKSIEQSLLSTGMSKEETEKVAPGVGNRVLRTQGLFTLGEQGVKETIANTLNTMGVCGAEKANSVAQNVNVDSILYGTPLEALEAVKVISQSELKGVLNSHIESAVVDDLEQSTVEEIKNNVNEIVFGSPNLQKAESEGIVGISDSLAGVLDRLTQGGDKELVDLVQQHFNQFKFPSVEMHEYLSGFSESGALLVKSLLDRSTGSSEKEMLRTLTEQNM